MLKIIVVKLMGIWCKKMKTHGLSSSPTYIIWQAMKQRCKSQPRYVKRGISVCDRWISSFENFYEDMGERPEDLTLERIDNEKGYSPENCRWATRKEQSRNRHCTRKITVSGSEIPVSQLAAEHGLCPDLVKQRLTRGWDLEKALSPSTKKFYTFEGKTLPLSEWSKILGFSINFLHNRLAKGWSVERAFSQKPRKRTVNR